MSCYATYATIDALAESRNDDSIANHHESKAILAMMRLGRFHARFRKIEAIHILPSLRGEAEAIHLTQTFRKCKICKTIPQNPHKTAESQGDSAESCDLKNRFASVGELLRNARHEATLSQ